MITSTFRIHNAKKHQNGSAQSTLKFSKVNIPYCNACGPARFWFWPKKISKISHACVSLILSRCWFSWDNTLFFKTQVVPYSIALGFNYFSYLLDFPKSEKMCLCETRLNITDTVFSSLRDRSDATVPHRQLVSLSLRGGQTTGTVATGINQLPIKITNHGIVFFSKNDR